MDPLNEAIKHRMEKFGLEKAISASQILTTINRVLPEGFLAKTFKDGKVKIETNSSSRAHFFKQDIELYIERINAAIGEPIVNEIRLWVKHTN